MPVRNEAPQGETKTVKKTATFKEFEKLAGKIPGMLDAIKESTELNVQGDTEKIPVLYVLFEETPENPEKWIKEFLFLYHSTSVVSNTNFLVEVVEEKKIKRSVLAFHKI